VTFALFAEKTQKTKLASQCWIVYSVRVLVLT